MQSCSPEAESSSRLQNGRGGWPDWIVLRWQCVHAANRLGAGPIEAEDLAQEAIARLLSAQPAVERPEAWLRTVVANLWRRQKRRGSEGDLAPEPAGVRREAGSSAARRAAKVDVDRALARVSPRTRRLLHLVLVGHTHREIAEALECEIQQVGPRIQRALEAARRRLEDAP